MECELFVPHSPANNASTNGAKSQRQCDSGQESKAPANAGTDEPVPEQEAQNGGDSEYAPTNDVNLDVFHVIISFKEK
ncbi:MAG: hypothetical protein IJ419_11730 [Agathobacter sp.]|nr:hypothetical protein [Agathobacter sp.]